ncbi:cupin domain-containing protein [Vallitalea okinawensis]|uniref:cupin domain-containing protein n=1 Tax=Vallitalea okinawensis TaxID=2078660 RepID=UPI000CFC8668|nr:cupin domain-containing protein [Vallitalea okinawensis]
MLGEKIRQKRNEINMSMKELALKTGLTPGFISQVERELAEPSITSLRKIADALEVAVFYFFVDEVNDNRVVKKGERQSLKFPGSHLSYQLLSPDLNRQMEMFLASLEPGAITCEEPLSHKGEEVIHVLKGTMWIKIGKDEYTLQEGDTIYYFASIPHKIINTGNEQLEFISTITPPQF